MSFACTSPSPSAWDILARIYDDVFTRSAIGRAQRAQVLSRALEVFRPGDHIIEVNCGTGVDAVVFAEHGIRVDAYDISPAMIAQAQARIDRHRVAKRVVAETLATEDLRFVGGKFDGAFSNFSGLNCVHDLRAVAVQLARLIKPCGHAVLCVSTRICLWEILWYSCRADFRRAFRRLHPNGVTAEPTTGAPVHVFYPSARSMQRTFAPEFHLQWIAGIGIATPPSYTEEFAASHPRFMRAADNFDRIMARLPLLRTSGDHMLLCLERRPQ